MKKIKRDGVVLAYEEAGRKDPPIIFVHGWCCNHTFLAPQLKFFARRHRVIGVDLRGHGKSGAPAQDYTMPAFADDIAWLCGEPGLKRPVVIGHSMGGNVALELAKAYPEVPAAIILIDSLVLPPESFIEENDLQNVAEGLRGPDYLKVFEAAVSAFLFIDTDDRDRKRRIIATMSKTKQHVMSSAFENHVTNYDGSAGAAGASRLPTAFIIADEPFVPLEPFRDVCPELKTGQTLGWGHFCPLFAPEQVNPMIARFLALI